MDSVNSMIQKVSNEYVKLSNEALEDLMKWGGLKLEKGFMQFRTLDDLLVDLNKNGYDLQVVKFQKENGSGQYNILTSVIDNKPVYAQEVFLSYSMFATVYKVIDHTQEFPFDIEPGTYTDGVKL